MRSNTGRAVGLLAAMALSLAACSSSAPEAPEWTEAERALIASLALGSLPPPPPDPSNAVADDPAAAEFGRALFSDTRLSADGEVSCASCHDPDRQFQDDRALGEGIGTTNQRTMPIAGTAYSPWLFWDGRKDSQWSQALGPLESPVEHGADRAQIAHLIRAHYAGDYESIFGPLPDLSTLPAHAAPSGSTEAVAAWEAMPEAEQDRVNRVFANVGKAIAAFERTIMPSPSRFDAYAERLASGSDTGGTLSAEELGGLRLFIGEGQCINCHNGPLLTDNYFHNTGVPAVADLPADEGRAAATALVLADPFNCLGPYSDAGPEDCAELRFMTVDGEELLRAYKPPSLRGVAGRPPYMHAGQLATLEAVLDHYNRAPAAPRGHSELDPLGLSEDQLAALRAFLLTLDPIPAEGGEADLARVENSSPFVQSATALAD